MEVEADADAEVRRRTWYGLTAVMHLRSRRLHRAGFGKLLIPHPPLVNRLLRMGLPGAPYFELAALHEFGHLQILPFIVVYTLAAVGYILATQKESFLGIVALLVGIHATWEMMAEIYVRVRAGSLYPLSYSEISMIPRIIFWSVMAAVSIAGWVAAMA